MRGRAVGAALFAVVIALSAISGAQASFPGDNGRIAYSSFAADGKQRAIHTMSRSGGRDRQLTRSGSARNPAWSPNGRLIAFDLADADDAPARVYLMRANGRRKRAVPTGELDARNPAWSPDGRQLVFQGCSGECEEDSIFVVGRRGRGMREIAAEGADPVWAPNGRWIAYAGKLRADGCTTIVLVKPSGRQAHAVLPDDPDENGNCAGAAGIDFAPNSRRLVYLGLHARQSGSFPDPITGEQHPLYTYDQDMYTVALDGDDQRLVARRDIEDSEFLLAPFAWSPDGDRLLWRDDRGTVVSQPDGGGQRRITGANGGGGDYAWQPLP